MRCGVDGRSLTENQPTGISWYTFSIVQAMAIQAPQDEFVIFISGRKPATALLKELAKLKNITIVQARWPNKLFHALAAIGVAPTLEHWLGKIDVLFAPNLHFLPHRATTPVVVTVHDVSFQLFPQFLSVRRWWWHKVIRPGKTIGRAKHVIAVSQCTKRDVVALYQLADTSCTVIPSGIPPQAPAEPIGPLPPRYILVLATFEPRKNITAALAAVQRYWREHPTSNLELVLAGASGWKTNDLVAQLGHSQRIHNFGYVTPGQKTTLLQQAQMLLYPSIYEGFGFPPLEALRLDVPVLASYTGALGEVLQQAAWYADPYSVTSIQHGIAVLDSDTAVRQQLLDHARELLPKYDWSKTAAATLNVLRQAI